MLLCDCHIHYVLEPLAVFSLALLAWLAGLNKIWRLHSKCVGNFCI